MFFPWFSALIYCFAVLLVTFPHVSNGDWCFDVEDDEQITWQSQDEHILTREDLKGVSNCEALSLSGLNISGIEDGALATLSKLRSLYLDDNKLGSLQQAMFQGSFKEDFESLSVSNNSISSMEKFAFRNLVGLEILTLHNRYERLCSIQGPLSYSVA